MDERILFDRIHQALDVEPRPDAYERLRSALVKKPVKPQRWPASSMLWPKMGLRLAAVMTLILIVTTAATVFLATHRVADRTNPADSQRAIAAYQKMVSDDFDKVSNAAAAWTCVGGEWAACEAGASSMLPVSNQWLNDLKRFSTPARFAAADAQLRLHIATQNSRIDALIAASRAHDSAAVDREMAAIGGATGGDWGSLMVFSILYSRQGTITTYVESVRSEKQGLDRCTECQDLAGQKQYSCAGDQASACEFMVDSTARRVASLQTAVVRIAAPNSLAAKDTRLQRDLGKAEIVLKAMVDALAARDQGGFDAGQVSLGQAMSSINQDIASVLNG